MKGIFKILPVILVLMPVVAHARNVVSRAARVTNTPTSGYTYNYMYPYLNNQMRQTLNPGDANAQSTSPINVLVRTTPMPESQNAKMRSVVPRRATARSAVSTGGGATMGNNSTVARSARGSYAPAGLSNENRRVAPRRAVARSGRTNDATNITTISSSMTGGRYVSSSQCLSDYMECMNSYCVRTELPYNRCFCSSRLAQIDGTYQPQIDSLVQQVLRAQGTTAWTDEEMAAYWYENIGQYVGENTWQRLEDALNIDWSDAGERMRGQNAYLTGHEYCMNHLRNCAYASPNMRDLYRSEISRDCTDYENSLKRLKTALESLLETYQNQ
ncbi:MAG: hypothetical protein J5608_00210 [Alphaproteobacteria bacterium]|nr:hypothetical protein [Alphaproteobacteria bacterium]